MLFGIYHSCYLDNSNITIDLLTKSLCIDIVSLVDCIFQSDLPLLFTLLATIIIIIIYNTYIALYNKL